MLTAPLPAAGAVRLPIPPPSRPRQTDQSPDQKRAQIPETMLTGRIPELPVSLHN
jgi:hypothetical protein